MSFPWIVTLLQRLDGGYTLENFDGIGRVVKTNSPSNTAFRGFGGPEGAFFIETIMDRISYELDLSPLKGKVLHCLDSVEVQFRRFQKNISQGSSRVKNLSCFSCAA